MKTHVFARAINSILKDNKFDRFVGNKRQGKLDFNNLARVAYSDKVFKKKEARKNKKYNILVLCDASGSMNASSYVKVDGVSTSITRRKVVKDSIEFLTDSLNKTDVDFSIWSFGGNVVCVKDFEQKIAGKVAGENYDKHFRSNIVLCTHCGVVGLQTDSKSCPYCGSYLGFSSSSNYNCDGLAVHLAQEALQNRDGEKILIVLSDGEADAISYYHYSYLEKGGVKYGSFPVKEVVKKVVKQGKIILCSIGIQNDAVLKIYPKENTSVVKELSEVTNQIIKIIKPKIKRG